VTGISVVKGHAYGNDFLLVPEAEVAGRHLEQLAQAMCHRLTGIGADGMMVYAQDGDRVRMRLFNADGSTSEVSGNGVRCLAALVVRGSPRTSRVTVDTPAGLKVLDLVARSGDTLTFRAAMGQPEDIRLLDLDAAGERVHAVALSVGNPQCVLLNDPLEPQRFQRLGPALERHQAFPNRTNVSFVRVEAPDRLRILIWERGVGPTTASGTGACGAAVAAAAHGGAAPDVEVISPGGSQRVEWRREDNNQIYLTGWARLVFDGRYIALSA
jgi:diaminopimelate epimerase